MRRPTPLPTDLVGRPFRVEEALAAGVTVKRLRSDDLWAPFRGVRVAVSLGWDPELRARCGLLVCPVRTAVVGFDAVAVAGLPLPFPVRHLLDQRLAVAPPLSFRPFQREGFDVEVAPLPLFVPRAADGVPRPADADLWARLVRLPPRIRGEYAVYLGRAVLARSGWRLDVLEEALVRHGPRALAGARWLLSRVGG